MHIVEYDILKIVAHIILFYPFLFILLSLNIYISFYFGNNSSSSLKVSIKFSQKIFELLETNIIIISKSKKFVRFFDDYKNFVESFIFIDIINIIKTFRKIVNNSLILIKNH